MTSGRDEIILTVGGRHWRGWTDIMVQRAVDQVSGQFELTLTARADDGMIEALTVSPGDACTVAIDGGETLITGWIDAVAPSYDPSTHEVAISGRDATGDLVDCSAVHAPSGEWQGVTVDRIAADLARPFGVPVHVRVDVGSPLRTFRIQESETAWEALERACRMRGLLAMADGLGGVVITRPGQAPRLPAVELPGKPLKRASGQFSCRDRFSHYTVKGQAAMDDLWGEVTDVTAPTGTARDPAVGRHRPLVMVAEDTADGVMTLDQRAAFEARTRSARARRVTLTMAGWRHPVDGSLWRPLTLLPVRDRLLRLDAEMLVAGVTLTRTVDAGTVAELSLIGPHAFDVMPLPATAASESGELGW